MTGALETSRLVTLTGAPGIGKTRLALAVADGRRDRASVVELAPVADPALVTAALASALSVHEVPGQSPIESVVATLRRRRRLLLVVDNCEHLLCACREVVDRVLAGCPEVRVLATSREPLGLAVERVRQVPPLSVPQAGELGPEELMSYSAVAMFVQRAREIQPGFALNAFLAAEVAEICRRLDGIPLAIELAAARVEMLTPGEIAKRLEDRLILLSDRGEDRAPRHRTLDAALDWSHDLLDAPERVLLRRLSVFAGRFELEAAEAVCAGGEVESSAISELLVGLASKSLLVAEPSSGADVQARCRLLETIRTYAREKLQHAGQFAVLRTTHARYYLTLAERAEPELTGADQERWLERLEAERANLRAAIEWSLSQGEGELALRLAGALVLFWRVRCHFTEGRGLLQAALSATDGSEAPALRARALWGAGFLTMMAGDADGAAPALEQSLEIFREQGDLHGAARALLILGNCNQSRAGASVLPLLHESATLARASGDGWCLAHALAIAGIEHVYGSGDLPLARDLFEECLSVARHSDEKQGLRIGLIGLATVAMRQGDYPSAESALKEALTITEQLDEAYFKADALHYLGWLALDRGDHARARELVSDAIALLPDPAPPGTAGRMLLLLARIAHASGDRAGARRRYEEARLASGPGTPILALLWLADLATEEGEVEEGRRLAVRSLAGARTLGHKDLIAQALHRLGVLALDRGNAGHAAALHNEALDLRRLAGAVAGIVASLEALAGIAAAAGRHHHAARLLGAADEHRGQIGCARLPWESARHDADLDRLRRSLSSEGLEAALAEGAALSLHEAAALAANGCRRTVRPSSGWPSLTDSERRVAALVAEGLKNSQIAERLCVSVGTVKKHLSHVFAKLDVERRTEVAREFWRHERRPCPGDSQ